MSTINNLFYRAVVSLQERRRVQVQMVVVVEGVQKILPRDSGTPTLHLPRRIFLRVGLLCLDLRNPALTAPLVP